MAEMDPMIPMEVDPLAGVHGSTAGEFAATTAQGYGLQNENILNALMHLPNSAQTSGWNAFRASNSILYGRKKEKIKKSTMKSSFTENRPGRLTKLSSSAHIDAEAEGVYSPMQFLARSANKVTPWIGRRGLNSSNPTSWLKRMSNAMIDSGFASATQLEGADKTPIFSQGMWARTNAAAKIGKTQPLASSTVGNIMDFIGHTDSNLAQTLMATGKTTSMSPGFAKGAILMSARSTGGQYIGGYLHGAGWSSMNRGLILPTSTGNQLLGGSPFKYADEVDRAAHASGKISFIKGAARASEDLALGGLERRAGTLVFKEGALVGEKAGLKAVGQGIGKAFTAKGGGMLGAKAAARFGTAAAAGGPTNPVGAVVSAAMTAWMIYDLTMMAGELIKSIPNEVGAAVKSFQGSIAKPIMGMGYVDTEVAATSRARGVMAIQNSRLNARTLLGNEGSMMAAHFG